MSDEDLEWHKPTKREKQAYMILIDLFFTFVDDGEVRLRVSLRESVNYYVDFIVYGNGRFEVAKRQNISDTDFWRIKFHVERNRDLLINKMFDSKWIVKIKNERAKGKMKKVDVEKLRLEYPQGTVLELIEDMQSDGKPEKDMKKGLQGKVDFVDDSGQIHMHWSNGRGLALIPEVDQYKKVEGNPNGKTSM